MGAFNGGMSNTAFLPATPVPADGRPASPSIVGSPLGTLPMADITPFAANVCHCEQAVADARALVRAAANASEDAARSTTALVPRAESLDWTGNAATMFRQRLRDLDGQVRLFEEQTRRTLQLCAAGAP